MAGPQVRLGGGWNCAVSQTTSGEASAEGDGGGDDTEVDEVHPATTVPTIATEITSRLMAAPTVRCPCRFPGAGPVTGTVVARGLHDGRL